jgi:hypothetical protein
MRLDTIIVMTKEERQEILFSPCSFQPYLAYHIHLFNSPRLCSKLLLCVFLLKIRSLILTPLFIIRNCLNPIWRGDNKMWTLFQVRRRIEIFAICGGYDSSHAI